MTRKQINEINELWKKRDKQYMEDGRKDGSVPLTEYELKELFPGKEEHKNLYCECEYCRKQCREVVAFCEERAYGFTNIIYVCVPCKVELTNRR